MKNQEVAEIFAQGGTAHTKTMFIEGNSIYSWGKHFKIAEKFIISDFDKITDFVLFNSDSYSSSTAKHKNYVLNALLNSGHKVIFMSECSMKNLKYQLQKNNADINTLTNKKTRNEITTARKNQEILKLNEQNTFLVDLAIKNGIIIEAI